MPPGLTEEGLPALAAHVWEVRFPTGTYEQGFNLGTAWLPHLDPILVTRTTGLASSHAVSRRTDDVLPEWR